jgi:hydrogenase nickel incorporation protein HypB
MCATCGCSDRDAKELAHDHAHEHGDHVHDHAHGHDEGHTHGHAGEHRHEHGETLSLNRAILEKNGRLAERNRGWLAARGALALNFVSSPGAGKTTLLERTIRDLSRSLRIAVVEGDQATSRDADRIRATGALAVQINTGTGCHLDAEMVGRALPALDPPAGSLVAIENVGNLVCPALFDLGEDAKVLVASVTEGDDKPLKYPHMFRASDLVLLNKMDLIEHVPFDVARFRECTHLVKSGLAIVPVSALTGSGLDVWYRWIEERLARTRAPLASELVE